VEKAPFAIMEKAPFRPQTRAGGEEEIFMTLEKGAFSMFAGPALSGTRGDIPMNPCRAHP
jgi:hypothetical protein